MRFKIIIILGPPDDFLPRYPREDGVRGLRGDTAPEADHIRGVRVAREGHEEVAKGVELDVQIIRNTTIIITKMNEVSSGRPHSELFTSKTISSRPVDDRSSARGGR